MTTKTPLIFSQRIGNSTQFVSPKNVDDTLNIRMERKKRNAGKERVRVQVLEVSQVVNYTSKPCGDVCGVNQQESGFVRLSGASPDEIKRCWDSLKENIDYLITKSVLSGVPVSIGENGLTVHDDVVIP